VRRAATHVPEAVRFATKPQLAVSMIARAIATGVPFAWATADSIYGVGAVEMRLRQTGKGYVLGVNATSQFNSWGREPVVAGTAAAIAQTLTPAAWQRLSAGEGTKGARLYDWAYLELADLAADEFNPNLSGIWTRGLLIRRSIADKETAYFTTWCPAGTPIETLAAVEGSRWAIEDSFETAKTELGLDHNETRSWHGWHRHVSLVMLAFAMLASIRHHANQFVPSQTLIRPSQNQHRPSSVGRSRKSAALPRALRSGASSPHASLPGHSGGVLTKPPRNNHI
jgi:SRSO17 transposase